MLNGMCKIELSEILNSQRIMIPALQISKSGLYYGKPEKPMVSHKMKSRENYEQKSLRFLALKIMLMMSGYIPFVGTRRRLVRIFKSGCPVRQEGRSVKKTPNKAFSETTLSRAP